MNKNDSGDDNNKMDDKELYKIAIETRNMEIGLFWQRSNYFLVLNTAIAVGFFSINNCLYQILLSAFGAFVSILWFRVNLGSKYWQSRWEYRVSLLEQKIDKKINLFSAKRDVTDSDVRESLLHYKKCKQPGIYDRWVLRKPSVSKTMSTLSGAFIASWLILFSMLLYAYNQP